MSLERKDIRAKLDPDVHDMLRAICEVEDVDVGLWIERRVPVIRYRCHAAISLTSRLGGQGITGNNREQLGKPARSSAKD